MINELLSSSTASTSPFSQTSETEAEETLRNLAREIVALTPTLAETLVRAGVDKQITTPLKRSTPTSTGC